MELDGLKNFGCPQNDSDKSSADATELNSKKNCVFGSLSGRNYRLNYRWYSRNNPEERRQNTINHMKDLFAHLDKQRVRVKKRQRLVQQLAKQCKNVEHCGFDAEISRREGETM